MITRRISVDFNGCQITCEEDGPYNMTQTDKINGLQVLQSESDLVSLRAKVQYIGCFARPDICASVQLLATDEENQAGGEVFR